MHKFHFKIMFKQGQTDRQTDTTGEETDPPPTHNLTASFDVTRSPVGDEPEAIEVYAFLK